MKENTINLDERNAVSNCCSAQTGERKALMYLSLCAMVLVIGLTACAPTQTSSTSLAAAESSIDREAARRLSDSIADDLVKNRRDGIRGKFENGFRGSVDEEEFHAMLDRIIEAYGQPLAYEYKQDELGSKSAEQQTKPIRKFWYGLKTTKYEKGSYFLVVEVVQDGDHLATSGLSIVTFPSEIPPTLK